MLFAIVLGTVLGAAGVTLLRQWSAAVFEAGRSGVLDASAFPRLAPPRRPSPYRRLPHLALQLRRVG